MRDDWQTPQWLFNKLNKIYNCDCLEGMRKLKDKSINLIILDPPYNLNYDYDVYDDNMNEKDYYIWLYDLYREFERILKKHGNVFFINYPETSAKIFWDIPELFNLQQERLIAWVYHNHIRKTPIKKSYRLIAWHSKQGINDNVVFKGRYRNPTDKRVKRLIKQGKRPTDFDWWLIEQVKNTSREKTKHPCQLPEKLIRKIILSTTKQKDVVLDPFAGSGTTLYVAKNLNRKYIGYELSENYVNIIKKRISQKSLMEK